MPLFKRNPFGHILFLKKWVVRISAVVSHGRYRRFNSVQIEGSEIIRSLPDNNVLFVSNHQTYFADVTAMFHVFNAALKAEIIILKTSVIFGNQN
jgi:1-acyl-sn-glycerol-3-phosphate acyltransferase